MKKVFLLIGVLTVFLLSACDSNTEQSSDNQAVDTQKQVGMDYQTEVNKYIEYELKSDLSHLSENQQKMLPLLFEAADLINELFWQVACGPYRAYYDSLPDDNAKKFFEINYGPWDRLNGNKSFVEGVGEKPLGAFFYPTDMDTTEFKQFADETKTSQYTIIERDENGNLVSVPYSVKFKDELSKIASLLRQAAELADDAGFKKYLELRADAFETDNYFDSDMAWMDMTDNPIEFVIGPIENYEDALYGYKAAFEAYILIKDLDWSEKLAKYTKLLAGLQKELPVPQELKNEEPGSNSQLNAYDVIYYAGDCNAGSKTIAINLPNDEKVQLAKGSRRLQLKNAMKAKFDNILIPIADKLIDPSQRQYVTFDAFFANTMFHEVAHGLGIKNTINGKGTCRKALSNKYNTYEEAKADILGLWLINKLIEMNEFEAEYIENQVTFVAGIFRSIRFGAASAHGKANLMRYNFFMEQGAITRNAEGYYITDPEKTMQASDSLARLILTIQGNGDTELATQIFNKYLVETDELKADLQKLSEANIPVDVIWKQGLE